MKIIFYGTRGYTKVKSKLHRKLLGTIISISGYKIYIDCGFNKNLSSKSVIIITKAIPLEVKCDKSKIYTTKSIAKDLRLDGVNIITCGHILKLFNCIRILPIHVIYRLGYEAIGIRIDDIFISHWTTKIPNFNYWLDGLKYYVGNGTRFVKCKKYQSSIISQFRQMEHKNIKSIFTNCGSDVIRNHKNYANLIEPGKIAYDGMVLFIKS